MSGDGNDRGEPPWPRVDRHVVRGADQRRASKVGAVGEFVEALDEPPMGGREAQVDHVISLIDRPAQPGDQVVAGALDGVPEDADATELAVRGERANDGGARVSMTAGVPLAVVQDALLAALSP